MRNLIGSLTIEMHEVVQGNAEQVGGGTRVYTPTLVNLK